MGGKKRVKSQGKFLWLVEKGVPGIQIDRSVLPEGHDLFLLQKDGTVVATGPLEGAPLSRPAGPMPLKDFLAEFSVDAVRCSIKAVPALSLMIPEATFWGEYGNFLSMDRAIRNGHLMLNYPYVAVGFSVLRQDPLYIHRAFGKDRVFIKSDSGDRLIPGTTVDALTVSSLINRTAAPGDALIVGCEAKEISEEYRCFVVEGTIVSDSSYRLGGQIDESRRMPAEGRVFAENVLRLWQPDEAFVLDLCRSEGLWKILEYNCFSTAGLYGTHDFRAIAEALQRLKGSKRL